MDHRLIEGLMEAVAPVVRDAIAAGVEKATAPLLARIVELESRAPEKGEKGDPGQSVTVEELRPLIEAEVATLPPAEPGKSVTLDDVRPILEGMVAALPKAENGKDADPELIGLMVSEAVDKLPPPEPGKSVTPDDLRPMLEEMVAALPKPENGKDADPELIELMISEAVGKLPPAEPGKSVDLEETAELISMQVKQAVAALPKPEDGKDGQPGQDGEPGAPGANGADGQPGRDGVDGKDVDPELVKALVDEQVDSAIAGIITKQSEAIAAGIERFGLEIDKRFAELPELPVSFLVNESGILVANYADGEFKSIGKVRGEDGLRGASLMDGSVDTDGTLTLRMSDGRIIQTGIVKGADGLDGRQGDQGPRGRDAHEIAIAPGVDETKSYAEGTCARWRGGVVRAERQTDPVFDGNIIAAGWSVILEGIAEETERVLEDDRTVERSTTYTSGKTFTRHIKSPFPVYRGVWREQQYERGDSVTFGGSQFIANRDTSAKPETEDCGWQLAVKRGRDGKEGKQGPVGPRPNGPSGERRAF